MNAFRVISSFDEMHPTSAAGSTWGNGRINLAADLLRWLLTSDDIYEICSFGAVDSWSDFGIRPLSSDDSVWSDSTPTVWLELGRHNLWPAAMASQLTGVRMPAVALTHSVGYGVQTYKNVASISSALSQDVIIAPSRAAKDALEQQFDFTKGILPSGLEQPHLFEIPWGVDDSDEQRYRLRGVDPFAVAEEADRLPLIAVVARLEKDDKCDWVAVLETLRRLRRVGKKFACVIVGYARSSVFTGWLDDQLIKLDLSDRVVICPNVDDETKWRILNEASIYLNFSVTTAESFGLAPVEAMRANCVPVLTDWGPFRELIRDGESGVLVPTVCREDGLKKFRETYFVGSEKRLGDEVAVDIEYAARRIGQLLDDNRLASRMAASARSRGVTQFSAEPMRRSLMEVLRSSAQFPKQKVAAYHGCTPFVSYPSLLISEEEMRSEGGGDPSVDPWTAVRLGRSKVWSKA